LYRLQIQKQIAQYETIWKKTTGGTKIGETDLTRNLGAAAACEAAAKGNISSLKVMLEYGADIHQRMNTYISIYCFSIDNFVEFEEFFSEC
jgi:hypothetical protein